MSNFEVFKNTWSVAFEVDFDGVSFVRQNHGSFHIVNSLDRDSGLGQSKGLVYSRVDLDDCVLVFGFIILGYL